MRTTFTALAGLLVTLALTQSLDKPPLESNLDYLQKGLLEYLQPVNNSYQKWDPAWIPADCKSLTENNNLSASDVEAFSVWYADVSIDFKIHSLSDRQSNASTSAVTILGFSAATRPVPIP